MTVRVEVPEGCKWCKSCGGVFPLDNFSFNTVRRASGAMAREYRGVCKPCQWQQRVKRDNPPPVKAAAFKTYWPRHPAERECDAALMGWRVAHQATVVAFQGPRL